MPLYRHLAASATTDTTNASNITSGTLAAARGGSGAINGVLSGNGSGSVNQGATSGLSDVVAPTSWTPTDASGGGNSFSSVTALYTKQGKFVIAQFHLTFPASPAGGSDTAAIGGLPVASSGSGAVFAVGSCSANATNFYNAVLVMNAGGTSFNVLNSAGNFATNTNLSNAVIYGIVTYISN